MMTLPNVIKLIFSADFRHSKAAGKQSVDYMIAPLTDKTEGKLVVDPFVTVIMPIRNEASYIGRSLDSVLAQSYPRDKIEIIVVDGMSTDPTRQVVGAYQERFTNIALIDNPEQIVPNGMNYAIARAKGEILVRVDGHCEIEQDYIRNCVDRLQEEDVDGVGGPMETIGETRIAKGIALAMSSDFGVGGSAFRTKKGKRMLVETVAFPAYRKEIVDRVGYYDTEMVRNQDDEYNYRIRKMGGKILMSPDIRSRYYSRSSLKSLWKQYLQYGYWKVRVLQKHPYQMRAPQFVPLAFVVALITTLLAWLLIPASWPLLALVIGLYLISNLTASVLLASKNGWQYLPIVSLSFAIIHLAYGAGFLGGLFRFIGRWKKTDSGVSL